ncbi:MAG: hypothetical protein IJZ19_07275, partial [Lentisphaeria bacterium]|nr:hypothetical protein [Lentisphaeria bacterium]
PRQGWTTSGYDLVQTEAREPRTGRQPTTTEADVRPLRADFFISLCLEHSHIFLLSVLFFFSGVLYFLCIEIKETIWQ